MAAQVSIGTELYHSRITGCFRNKAQNKIGEGIESIKYNEVVVDSGNFNPWIVVTMLGWGWTVKQSSFFLSLFDEIIFVPYKKHVKREKKKEREKERELGISETKSLHSYWAGWFLYLPFTEYCPSVQYRAISLFSQASS